MGSLQNSPSLVSSSKLITRVTNYQTVASLWESAKGYYAWSKEASPIVNYVETSLEGGLHKSLNWISPKVEPVLKSQAFENYAKPLLTTVDDFGVKQLENVEGRVDKFNQVYKQSKENLEKRVETIKDTTRATLEGVNHAVIEPVDSYLSHSVLAAPINLALNVTEKVVDKYVVKESEKEQEKKNANDIGPIFRTTRLSKKLQREAFEKLKTLSLRTPEKIHAMTYTVDLIQYAATTLDNGVVKISKKMNQGVQEISNGAKYVYDAPKKILSKENFEKLNKYTKDAFHAVALAADNISKQIPAPITNRVQQTYLTLKDTATHNLNGEEVDFALFSNLVGKSSDLLKSVSGTISQYVAKGEQVPTQLLHTAKENLLGVLDLLGVVQKHAASEKAEGKALKENGSTNGIHALDSSDRAATPL